MLTASIIVPCLNEEKTILLLLDAINKQSFPHDQMEIIIADGYSTDNTRQEIQRFQKEHTEFKIRLVDNPKQIIPAALNKAIEAAEGQYIIRLDAHSMPYPDYVERCVQSLEENRGTNVGGIWEIQPGKSEGHKANWIARGIAAATAHPLGVGDAFYRFTSKAQVVDTVPFGAFRRDLVEKIGFFDETLLTNEDYEFNTRIRATGGKIWLDPSIRSIYFARSSLTDLAKQYWRYGYWKGRMLQRFPNTIRWRQTVPPLFVASLISWFILSIWWLPAKYILVLEILLYVFFISIASLLTTIKKRDLPIFLSMSFAIVVMHITWGAGLLSSLLSHKKN